MPELDQSTRDLYAREEVRELKRENLGRGVARAIQQTKDARSRAEEDGVETPEGRAARAKSSIRRGFKRLQKFCGSKRVPEESSRNPKTAFVEARFFNIFCGFLIMANTCNIGIELDTSWEAKQTNLESSFESYLHVAEFLFCVFFVAEMSCRIHHHGAHFFYTWFNVGDFALVVAASLAFLVASVSSSDVRFIAVLRMVRILRLMRLLRLVHVFDGLLLVLIVVGRALRSITWITLIIVAIIYACAMVTTLLLGQGVLDGSPLSYWLENGWDVEKYFGTMARSMFTLSQVVTLDDWAGGIVRHADRQLPGIAVFFVLVVYVINFGMLNLIVGTMVEITLCYKEESFKKREKSQIERDKQIVKSLRDTLQLMDVDKSLSITPDELEEALKVKEIAEKLRLVGFPADDPEMIFRLCDVDMTGSLSLDDFLAGVLKMSGRGKSRDVFEVRFTILQLQHCLAALEAECDVTKVKLLQLEDSAITAAEQAQQCFHPQKGKREQSHGVLRADGGRMSLSRTSCVGRSSIGGRSRTQALTGDDD